MRADTEIFDLILKAAHEDDRIRAVYMNGSRTNPNVVRDSYRDFDIVYVVKETSSFLANPLWITIFGEIMIMQEPDSYDCGWGVKRDHSQSYTWLALYSDGTRIDMHIETVEEMKKTFGNDSLTVILMDKDKILPAILPPSDQGYWIKKPRVQQCTGCCNEFWWCLNNIAKGIVRDQMPYVMRMYFETVHKELHKMLEWYIGMNHGYRVTSGMWGKYFKKLLPEEYYQLYEQTFPEGNYESIWKAVFTACRLFRMAAMEVDAAIHYDYPELYERNMMIYLEKMKNQ